MKKTLALLALALLGGAAQANCVCRCVEGQMRPICTSALDLPPLCPLAMCGAPPPSLAPLPALQLPPLGAQSCRQVQVMNPNTGRYEWRTLCQ